MHSAQRLDSGAKHCGRTRYYHRQVTLMLLPGSRLGLEPIRLLLDAEAQRPGEDEMAADLRLLKRVIPAYPRAFDLVVADALCATAPLFNSLLSLRKPWRCGKRSAASRRCCTLDIKPAHLYDRSRATSPYRSVALEELRL